MNKNDENDYWYWNGSIRIIDYNTGFSGYQFEFNGEWFELVMMGNN